MPWIHVENLVDMLMLTSQGPEAVGQAYNAVDGHVPTAEFQGRIAAWLGRETQETSQRAGFIEEYPADKIRALGYRPRITFGEAMEELRLACLDLGLITK